MKEDINSVQTRLVFLISAAVEVGVNVLSLSNDDMLWAVSRLLFLPHVLLCYVWSLHVLLYMGYTL